ncbi:MAG TPA: pentapeptide repeat-containing protein, partial [Gemmatimonadaceae bacterium]|nr:pentapeptide repeat-containing protein [Gemmatimonadaceae bacterium]
MAREPEHCDSRAQKSAYANAFKSALQSGEILLVLDGVDELLHQDMAGFTKNLLELVKYWVASSTPGGRIVPTRRALYLDEVWTYEQMALSLDLRMPNGSPRAKIRETVKETVREVMERHNQALREGTTDQDHHWLSQAGNFHLFLGSLTPQTSEHEIRKLAESQPYLFREIFHHAVHHIDADADLLQLRDRLFDLAVTDPTSPRDGVAMNVEHRDDRIAQRIEALGEITQKTIKGPAFRHAAMREYFLAGRIAREILDPAVRTDNTDELARSDRWHSSKRDAIISWFDAITPAKIDRLRARLRLRADGAQLNPTMRRNLLDVLLTLDRAHGLDNLDLSGIPGDGIDLKKLDVRGCTFANAQMRNAELSGATFTDCDFSGANLSAADASGARFDNCAFENAKVQGLAIRDAKFSGASNVDERKALEEHGAVDFRTRYRDEFGEAWPAFQKAALGPEYEKLEDNVYLPAIRDALKTWDAMNPVYMVDLMAGGSYRRVTDLLDEFSNLHIVGIDRDPSKQARPQRLAWTVAELGGAKSNGTDRLGIDFRESLTNAFGDTAYPVQAIVGKKALHEIDRALQPALIERCADALAQRGRLILFADAPGPVNREQLDGGELSNLHRQLSGLRDFLGGDPSPSEVGSALDAYAYDGSPT